MNHFLNPEKIRKSYLALCDAALVTFVFFISYIFRIIFYEQGNFLSLVNRISWLVILGILIHVISFYVFGLYDRQNGNGCKRHILLVNIAASVLTASIFISILSFAFPHDKIGRVLIFIHFVVMIGLMYVWRLVWSDNIFKNADRKLLIVGWNSLVEKIVHALPSRCSGYAIKGVVILPGSAKPPKIGNPAPSFLSVDKALEQVDPEALIVSEKLNRLDGTKSKLIDLKFQGKEIFDGASFYERILSKVPVSEISERWLLFNSKKQPYQPALYQKCKRLMDVFVSGALLLSALPLLLVIALLIKIDSNGPVLFRQERLGMNESPFILLKFRTMVNDAERHCGPCWAERGDPRLTRIGRILRKTRLDELPQFFNVLMGDMSLVGPRPIRKYFADLFTEKFPFYRLRFKVKPGITGWAQVNMDYVNTEQDQYDKLEYEFYYLYHQSMFLDLFILLKTMQAILKLRGG
jgi:exopolysaccharide biosynthesis polyprenyl glycosylphosphotransferase